MPAPRDKAMYGITRVDSVEFAQHGWMVSIGRRRTKHQSFFPDVKYGGQKLALRAAQAIRDRLAAEPLMSKQDYVSIVRRNNNSGVPGVCRMVDTGRGGRKSAYWLAFWPKENGRGGRAKFSVEKYGEALAFQLAVRAREDAISGLDGPHITSAIQRDWLDAKSRE